MQSKFGRTCLAGGRRIELISEHYEWIDWANEWLLLAAKLETAIKLRDHETVAKVTDVILKTAGGTFLGGFCCGWLFRDLKSGGENADH